MLTDGSMAQSFRAFENGTSRIKGGRSETEYEQLHSYNSALKKPNFSENRDHYRSIGWGVTNSRLVNLPLLQGKQQAHFERRASIEREIS